MKTERLTHWVSRRDGERIWLPWFPRTSFTFLELVLHRRTAWAGLGASTLAITIPRSTFGTSTVAGAGIGGTAFAIARTESAGLRSAIPRASLGPRTSAIAISHGTLGASAIAGTGIGGTALAIPRTALGAALRWYRHEFIRGQFAVAIFVELLQRSRSVRDFLGGNLAVAIRIERRDDGRHETRPAQLRFARSALRALSALLRPAFGAGLFAPDLRTFTLVRPAIGLVAARAIDLARATLARWSGWRCVRGLRAGEARGKRERDEDCFGFHGVVFLLLVLGLPGRAVGRAGSDAIEGTAGEEKWESSAMNGAAAGWVSLPRNLNRDSSAMPDSQRPPPLSATG